ncbi:MAG: hypothetical protein HC880_15335 [Bacteroidia bacterium]|nr:hypothetical protein [Bacteroidia bacterium]
MNKSIFFTIIGLLAHFSLMAQSNYVGNILEQYIKTKERIQNKELHSNVFRLNLGNLAWNNSLVYGRQEQYYYGLSDKRQVFLQLLVVTIDSSNNQYQIEYLFDNNGKLIYCLEQQANPRYHYRELRTFYREEKLIQLSEDNVVVNSSTIFHSQKVKYFLESARYYWDKFLYYMNQARGG